MIFILIPLSACGLVDGPSGYDTHAIEKLQKEVPFTIVVPTYFPEGIEPYPTAIGFPNTEAGPNEPVSISLTYERGTDNYIFITEGNREMIEIPSQSSYGYLDIGGIQVLEEMGVPWLNSHQPSSNASVPHGISYSWNRNGVHFNVYIIGYGQDECRKIVESMIQPME
jgi:hypothetical protein